MKCNMTKEKCSICGSPDHTHLHCYGTPAQRTSKQKVPELPAELRRCARISTSGYWAGMLLEAADEIERLRAEVTRLTRVENAVLSDLRQPSETTAELAADFDRAATLESEGHGYTVWRIGGRQFVPLDETKTAQAQERNEFKNFHRLLCERVGYGHDERDWKRDQLSLIEYIARRIAEVERRKAKPATDPKYIGEMRCTHCGKDAHYAIYEAVTSSSEEPTRHLTESERASFDRALRKSTHVVHEGEMAPEKASACLHKSGCSEPLYKAGLCEAHYRECVK